MEEQLPKKNDWAGRLTDWEGQGNDDYQPNPGGWSRLEAELAPEKGRRSWLWLLLLPLCLGVGFYVGHQTAVCPDSMLETAGIEASSESLAKESTSITAGDATQTHQDDPLVSAPAMMNTREKKEQKTSETRVAEISRNENKAVKTGPEITEEKGRAIMVNVPTLPRAEGGGLNKQLTKVMVQENQDAPATSEVKEGEASPRPLGVASIPTHSFSIEGIEWPVNVGTPNLPERGDSGHPSRLMISVGLLAHSQAQISALNTPERSRPLSSNQQSGPGAGIGVLLDLPGRFGLQTGLTLASQNNDQTFLIARTYQQENEQTDLSATFPLELNTGFSKVEMELTVSRPTGVTLDNPRNIIFRVTTDNSIRVMTVPLLLTYEQPLGKQFSLRAEAGFNWHQLRGETSLTATLASANGLRYQRTLLRAATDLFSPDYWSWQTGLAFSYRPPGSHWSLSLAPTFQQPLNKSLDFLPGGTVGCKFGAWYRF